MIVTELWREALRFRARFAAVVLLLVLVAGTCAAQALALAAVLTAAVHGHTSDLLHGLVLVVVAATARLVLTSVQASMATRLGSDVRSTMRRRALRTVLTPEHLHDTATRDGSLRTTLVDGVDGVDTYVSFYVPAVAGLLVTCPLLVFGLVLLSPWAGTAVGVGLVVATVGPKVWGRLAARCGMEHWDSYEALGADLLESLRGMATLRVLGDVPGTRRRLEGRSEALRRATERVMRVSLAETAVTDLAVQAGTFAAAAIAVVGAATGGAASLHTYLILLMASEVFRPVRDLSRHWHAGFLGLSAVAGLRDLGAFTQPSPLRTGPARTHPTRARADELQVTNLTFRYPGAGNDVLRDVELRARRGTLTAVVGPSGSGKSTLFDLMLGFLQPSQGRLELDGEPLNPRDIAVVSQRPVLFAGTVRDNIVLSGPGTGLEDACRAAGVLEEILALPRGFDTEVSEAGTGLSGGQRQRIALARALLTHRPVLLVDEPTSALDDANAATVVDTLHRVAGERVVVMISHRPETFAGVRDVLRLGTPELDGSHA